MTLNRKLLEDFKLEDRHGAIKSDDGVKGYYNHILYILRLSPEVYNVLHKLKEGDTEYLFPGEIIQAKSTAFHENIHWWQYIGSISGLIMSLSMPAQIISNMSFFRDYLKLVGKKKPIVTYNENNPHDNFSLDPKYMAVNQILNTYHDIKYFKWRIKKPDEIKEAYKDNYFLSVGHTFHVTYSCCLKLISSTIDEDYSFLPNPSNWVASFDKLADEKADNFFYEQKDLLLPPIGTIDLFEGQARFNQMLYLHFKYKELNEPMDWYQFEREGMLEDEYYSAFQIFLELLGEQRPSSINSPLVALYLLLIDIAINPAEGFIFDIEAYEQFVNKADPAIRFVLLCSIVQRDHPYFKGYIKEYSSKEYWEVSTALCTSLGFHPPKKYLAQVIKWYNENDVLKELLKENDAFVFRRRNIVVRLLYARFLDFQLDKSQNPEFFCWPGVYLESERSTNNTNSLYVRHQALFKENQDMDVGPADFEHISDATLEETAGLFYSMVTTLELCEQWITKPGKFDYDLRWLSKKHSSEEMKNWVKDNFINEFGVSPDDFEEIISKKSS